MDTVWVQNEVTPCKHGAVCEPRVESWIGVAY